MKRYATLILFIWLAISLIIGFVGCERKLNQLFQPEPISITNQPRRFYVIGFDMDKKPVILMHEISAQVKDSREFYSTRAAFESAMRHESVFLNCDNNSSGPFTFYIPKSETLNIEKNAKGAIDRKNFEAFHVKILDDDPVARNQTVRIDFYNDDFSYYCIYEVKDGKIKPVKYGDVLKADGFDALMTGIGLFLSLSVSGWFIINMLCFVESKRAKANLTGEAK